MDDKWLVKFFSQQGLLFEQIKLSFEWCFVKFVKSGFTDHPDFRLLGFFPQLFEKLIITFVGMDKPRMDSNRKHFYMG